MDPEERSVACPNQDVVYGIGALALDLSPVRLHDAIGAAPTWRQ